MDEDIRNLFDDGDATEEQNGETEMKPEGIEDIPLAVTKKKRTLKPRPTLNPRKLMGERGIPALQKEFEHVKFKGRGHEVEDLDSLLSHLEHWAHRLHPKMTFDDCLEKIERLGHKKEIQVCMKKLRMGMPLLGTEGESTVITGDGPPVEERDTDEEILTMPMNDDF